MRQWFLDVNYSHMLLFDLTGNSLTTANLDCISWIIPMESNFNVIGIVQRKNNIIFNLWILIIVLLKFLADILFDLIPKKQLVINYFLRFNINTHFCFQFCSYYEKSYYLAHKYFWAIFRGRCEVESNSWGCYLTGQA